MSVNNLGILLNGTNRRGEALKLLRAWAAISPQAEDSVRYNLACYECLDGNIDEAKRLIASHLKIHLDEKKGALEDADLALIRDFIQAL